MKEKECVQSAGQTVWKHRQKHKDSTALQSKPDMVCTPHLNRFTSAWLCLKGSSDHSEAARGVPNIFFLAYRYIYVEVLPNVLNRILIHPCFPTVWHFYVGDTLTYRTGACCLVTLCGNKAHVTLFFCCFDKSKRPRQSRLKANAHMHRLLRWIILFWTTEENAKMLNSITTSLFGACVTLRLVLPGGVDRKMVTLYTP